MLPSLHTPLPLRRAKRVQRKKAEAAPRRFRLFALYRFSPGLNASAARKENRTAAAMPPAVAVSPPVITPSQPDSPTALDTPLAG